MGGFFDHAEVDLPCPKCGSKTRKTIGWIKSHAQFTCRCGQVITLDKRKFTGEIDKADRAVDDFLDNFNK